MEMRRVFEVIERLAIACELVANKDATQNELKIALSWLIEAQSWLMVPPGAPAGATETLFRGQGDGGVRMAAAIAQAQEWLMDRCPGTRG